MHTYPELIMNRGINLIGPHGCYAYTFVLINTTHQPSILTSSFFFLTFLLYQNLESNAQSSVTLS